MGPDLVAFSVIPALISVKFELFKEPQAGSTARVNGEVALINVGQSPADANAAKEMIVASSRSFIAVCKVMNSVPDPLELIAFKGSQPGHADRQLKEA